MGFSVDEGAGRSVPWPCGSRRVRGSASSGSGHGSPSGRGTRIRWSGSVPWLNQSLVWNCSQAAAITFSVVAGIISGPRASNRVLTRRGFGVSSRSPCSGMATLSGTLRPNRVLAMPIAGEARSL